MKAPARVSTNFRLASLGRYQLRDHELARVRLEPTIPQATQMQACEPLMKQDCFVKVPQVDSQPPRSQEVDWPQ